MPKLVFVHGRAQEFKDPAVLKGQWIEALRRGLDKAGLQLPVAEGEIRFPYYGQALNNLLAGELGEGGVMDIIIKGPPGDATSDALLASVADEARRVLRITEDDIREAEAEVQAADTVDVIEKGKPRIATLAILRATDKYVPGAGLALKLATSDVDDYIRNPGIRDAIEAGVRGAFTSKEPTVVVGHSLGSVVAYALLKREGAMLGWDVPIYVTLGSPLGIEAVRQRFAPIGHPECVHAWFNARDREDVVALNPLDDAHFLVDPKITNKNDVANHTPNHHGIVGYLDDAEVARRIHGALTSH